MGLCANTTVRLEAADEYTHLIEAARNFNESMYVNLFDHAQHMAATGAIRIGEIVRGIRGLGRRNHSWGTCAGIYF